MSTDRMKEQKNRSGVTTACDINPDIWLDFVDNDIAPSLKKDLELHLQECPRCRQNYAEFQGLNKIMRQTAEPQLPNEETFQKLEARIMDSVAKTYIESNVVQFRKSRIKIYVSAAAAVFVLVFGSLFIPSSNQFRPGDSRFFHWHSGTPEDEMIVENADSDLEVFNDVIMSHQDSDDLVLNAAAEKLSRMSDREARAEIDKIKK